MIRDTWRAVLVVAVAVALRAIFPQWQPPAPVHVNQWQPSPPVHVNQWQPPAPVHVNQWQPPADRPLRRIGEATINLGDAILGAIRR